MQWRYMLQVARRVYVNVFRDTAEVAFTVERFGLVVSSRPIQAFGRNGMKMPQHCVRPNGFVDGLHPGMKRAALSIRRPNCDIANRVVLHIRDDRSAWERI